MGRVSTKIFLITFLTLVVISGITLTFGSSYDGVWGGGSQNQEEDSRAVDYVLSNSNLILERLLRNETFKAIVGNRRWILSTMSNPKGVGFTREGIGGSISEYAVDVTIFDDDGNLVEGAGIRLDLSLRIIEVKAYPIILCPGPPLDASSIDELPTPPTNEPR